MTHSRVNTILYMIKKLYKLLFLFITLQFNAVFADSQDNSVSRESLQLDQIHEALDEFSRSNSQSNVVYEQKKREMLDSVETRFYACDPDNDNTLDVYETTVCLPQVARQFRYVDINNDNVISLDELSILAKDFHNKINKKTANSNSIKDDSNASLPVGTPINN